MASVVVVTTGSTGTTESGAPRLSTRWVPARVLDPFYGGSNETAAEAPSTIAYSGSRQVLFSLYKGAILVVDPASCGCVGRISVYGDAVSAFAVNNKGDVVVGACKSGLLRVWKVGGWTKEQAIEPDAVQYAEGTTPFSATNVRSWKGPNSAVTSITLDSLRLLVSVGCVDGSVFVYGVESGVCTHAFPKRERVQLVRFHPTRALLFAAHAEGAIRVYDLYRHICVAHLAVHTAAVTAIDFIQLSAGGGLGGLVSASRDRTVNVWSLDSLDTRVSERLARFARGKAATGEQAIPTARAGEPASVVEREAAAAYARRRAKKRDSLHSTPHSPPAEGTKAVAEMWGACKEAEEVLSAALEPTQQFATEEEVECVLCVATRRLAGCRVNVQSKDGKAPATAGGEAAEANPRKKRRTGPDETARGESSERARETSAADLDVPVASVCPWAVLIGGEKGQLSLWDPSKRRRLISLATPHCDVGRVIFLSQHSLGPADIRRVISVGEDHNIVFWDMSSLRVERLLLGCPSELLQGLFLPVSPAHCQLESVERAEAGEPETAVESAAADNTRKRKRRKKEQQKEQQKEQEGVESPKGTSAAAPPLERAVVLRSDQNVTLLEFSPERVSASLLRGHDGTVISVASSVDGCWIASGSKDCTVRLWSARTGQAIAVAKGHTAPVTAVEFGRRRLKSISCSCMSEGPGTSITALPVDPGLFVVSVCLESILKVWPLDRNRLRRAVAAAPPTNKDFAPQAKPPLVVTQSVASRAVHEREVTALAVAPNDKLVATGSADKSIKLWTLPDLRPLGVCTGHRKGVTGLAFSPIEKVVVSASRDCTLRIWSLSDFACLKTFQGHTRPAVAVDFLSAGTQLISAGADGQVKLWTIRRTDCVGTFDSNDGKKILSLSLNEGRDKMLSCNSQGRLILWRDDTLDAERAALEQAQQEAAETLRIDALASQGKSLDALTLAVRLNRPFQTRQLLRRSLEKTLFERLDALGSSGGAQDLTSQGAGSPDQGALSAQEKFARQLQLRRKAEETAVKPLNADALGAWMAGLDEPQLKRLLEFLTLWNANGKTATLANSLMSILLKALPAERLLRVEGFPSFASNFLTYLPRHLSRLSGLIQRSFILELVLFASGVKGVDDVADLPQREGFAAALADEEEYATTHNKEGGAPPEEAPEQKKLSEAEVYDVLFG